MAAAVVGIAVTQQLSPGNDCVVEMVSNDRLQSPPEVNGTPGAKRKRKALDPPTTKANAPRQKITRACDHCKEKKTRCSGTRPCVRCMRLALRCEYNAAYSRGLPPEPLRASTSVTDENHSPFSVLARDETPRSARSSSRTDLPARRQQPKRGPEFSRRNSPDPVATDFEGNYFGPASGVSFLNRVWRRLHQDEICTIPDELQNESVSKNTSVFMFGDKPYSDYRDTGFVLPPYERALELVNTYFDFSMVTYRFLHRGSVEEWLKQVYQNKISSSNLPSGPMIVRTAIILMIFAVTTLYEEKRPGNEVDTWNGSERWYSASKYMISMEFGPPRLETVQARLGQCLFLLASSRANECWYAFGTALQLVTALGLHRKCPAKLLKNGNNYLERELRKRIFWSAYTLDKYLSVMFGRPRLLHDEDNDQEFPDEMNDDDMAQDDPERRTGAPDCMMIASVLHFKLGRIVGEISRQIYTISPQSRDQSLETAASLTSELVKWKETAPPLFNSVRATSLIPPLCRQSQVLQLAYSHAIIHATRSFLLNDFTDLSRRPPIPHPTVTGHVRKCIEAAEDIIKLVDSLAKQDVLIQSFWFTHYVCFCAIIVVYIYTIQQCQLSSLESPDHHVEDHKRLRSLFNLAEVCQQHLAEATRKNCPSRRYSIILEELRLEVHRQIGSFLNQEPPGNTSIPLSTQEAPLEQRNTNVAVPGHQNPLDANSINYLGGLQTPEMTGQLYSCEDMGLLDNLEGSIWWTQLDSWAFSNLPTDPTGINL
ncbi:Zn(II)2Cys6 transcription factor [Aspergillus affinis]|uniref:Zn(II)2Cys6 transcription factor n=1 Tax=Aspergillus affinis TaxID=1070780 RepID=UPI0022FEDB5B|nr:uncharacterized protein KD926_003990 [Aspergillus affinis]KAI9046152.1 hypothetical protein KD926_003990 [Aspergillus affinis]